MSGVNNGKFVINISDRLKFGRRFYAFIKWLLECFYSDEIVKQKNVHYICNHCIRLITRYITSLTQYLSYSLSLPQDTFDLYFKER